MAAPVCYKCKKKKVGETSNTVWKNKQSLIYMAKFLIYITVYVINNTSADQRSGILSERTTREWHLLVTERTVSLRKKTIPCTV